MHAIFHAILRTISIQSPDHDTQALERAPVFCCARVFFDAVRAALRVAIGAGQTKGLILRYSVRWPSFCASSSSSSSCSNSDYWTVIWLCLGAYRKPIFLVLHLKIKLFPMFSITIDLVGKYRTQATARRRSRERTLSWTNWLVQ